MISNRKNRTTKNMFYITRIQFIDCEINEIIEISRGEKSICFFSTLCIIHLLTMSLLLGHVPLVTISTKKYNLTKIAGIFFALLVSIVCRCTCQSRCHALAANPGTLSSTLPLLRTVAVNGMLECENND